MNHEPYKRWDWINGFVAAALHALLADLKLTLKPDLTFSDACEHYSDILYERLASTHVQLPVYPIEQSEVEYLFHLEAELWGPDYGRYIRFFQDDEADQNVIILQTFLFPMSFFLIERWLNFFIPESKRSCGRGKRRRYLFGKDDGVFSVQSESSLQVMGVPFNLFSSTTKVLCKSDTWSQLKQCKIPPSLENFYRSVTGKSHFTEIIEASYKRTRNKLPDHLGALKGEHFKAYWYDALWVYSESIRYNSICPSDESLSKPFYWGRSIRWFTSLTITALATLAKAFGADVIKASWPKAVAVNPLLNDVIGESRNYSG